MYQLGSRIKQLRMQKGLTQTQLAERLGITKSMISAYECGLRYPSLDMLIKFANSFHVTTDYLLGIPSKQFLDITNLSPTQVMILNGLINEFTLR